MGFGKLDIQVLGIGLHISASKNIHLRTTKSISSGMYENLTRFIIFQETAKLRRPNFIKVYRNLGRTFFLQIKSYSHTKKLIGVLVIIIGQHYSVDPKTYPIFFTEIG